MWSRAIARRSWGRRTPALGRRSSRVSATAGASFRLDCVVYRGFASSGDGNDKETGDSPGGREISESKPTAGDASQRRGGRAGPEKRSFASEFIEPAVRGQLRKNHRSGIPRTMGRPPKGHGVRGADVDGRFADRYDGEDDDGTAVPDAGENGDADESLFPGMRPPTHSRREPAIKTGTIRDGSPIEDLNPQDLQTVKKFLAHIERLEQTQEKDDYYWDEAEYDFLLHPDEHAMLQKLSESIETDEEGNRVAKLDDEELYNYFVERYGVDEDSEDALADTSADTSADRSESFGEEDDVPPVVQKTDILHWIATNPTQEQVPEDYDQAAPITDNGTTVRDTVEAMVDSPKRIAEFRFENPHAESRREPRPRAARDRRDPPRDFLNTYKRFVFVTGLPPLVVDGTAGSIDNPLHCNMIEEHVAELIGVAQEQVRAANLTSAFIGFETDIDRRYFTEVDIARSIVVESPLRMSQYQPTENDSTFCKNVEDAILLVENLPMGMTSASVARSLFPTGTDLAQLTGDITARDVAMMSPHSAIVRFRSSDTLQAVLSSDTVQQRLVDLGQHRVRRMKARRNLKFTGRQLGAIRANKQRIQSDHLVVDALDMPTRRLYRSHFSVIRLQHLDDSVTKQDIANFFQPFCKFKRDVEGSVEFVTCLEGVKTGHAYVGFDEHGEAESVLEAFQNGRIEGLGEGTVRATLLRDLVKIKRHVRQIRPIEELLADLDGWERFVDPEDIVLLEKHGVPKEVLDETFRSIRRYNTTFAANDQAIRSETLNPEKEVGGMYEQYVREYIETMKESIATKENPGAIYESMYLPEEEMDFDMFEEEAEQKLRMKALRKIEAADD